MKFYTLKLDSEDRILSDKSREYNKISINVMVSKFIIQDLLY
jgi:hypothetical protein